MQKVFISNTKNTGVENIILDSSSTISKSFDDAEINNYKNGDFVFIIDIHCTFNGTEKMQQQGGVFVYRHLLNHFEGHQDKLKVVFYSPISSEDLVKLKPENYVLELLPFVECKYEEGQFTKDLKTEIDNHKDSWLQFNNASENLLSGWALCGKEPINVNGKKILFIDDQQSEWENTFSGILEKNALLYLENKSEGLINSQEKYRQTLENYWTEFKELAKSAVAEKPDLILSDFYLKENHDITKWKNVEEIKKISGFDLFEVLRKTAPATPYVFHTSSNKASIHKFLNANGIDDWLVKDTRIYASANEKIENYGEFKDSIVSFLQDNTYNQIEKIWNKILKIKENQVDYYNRFSDNNSEISKEIKEIVDKFLEHSWIALRRSLKREKIYEENVLTKVVTDFRDWYVAVSVVNNLGKIIEYLAPKYMVDRISWNDISSLAELGYQIRTCGSHYQDNEMLRMTDIFILYEIVFNLIDNEKNLTKESENKIGLKDKIANETGGILQRPFALFWVYIIFHNNTQKFKSFCPMIKERIYEYWNGIEKKTRANHLNNELNAELKKLIIRTDGASGNFELIEKEDKILIEES